MKEVLSTNGIVPPEGGTVRILTLRRVDESRLWIEALLAGGPQTPKTYDVRKVGDQYPPMGGIATLSEVMAVNFGARGIASPTILTWAKQQHLRPASPRRCFATAEQYPDLNTLLGVGNIAVVSLEECSFGGSQHCCIVWWCGAKRWALLACLANDWFGICWFLFVRE